MPALLPDGHNPVSAVPTLEESIHCFRTRHRARPARAKFNSEEREKVLGVRRQGACLRCRILKIQCSLENPCQPCLQSAVRGYERKVLSFCYCVRTRFADVNIFNSPARIEAATATTMQTETLLLAMSRLLSRIATPASFSLTSNPAAFNNTMVSWLTDPDFHLPNGSIVGLCCSSLLGLQFQEGATATSADATDGLVEDFRRFLLATSLVHAGWRDGSRALTTRELAAGGQAGGCRLLKRLDRVLTPQFLARCGRESCQVLFLLVLGAVLGVGYSSSQLLDGSLSPEFPPAAAEMLSPEFRRSPTLWLAMKEHLCQMLAHHLIFIGSMLGIRFETGLEQRIIDTAVSRWNKAEEFVWADVVSSTGPPAAEFSPGVKKEGGGSPVGQASFGGARSASSNPPSPRPLASPQLVPMSCPEASQFSPREVDGWTENPQSYLSMFEPAESAGPSRSGSTTSHEPRCLASEARSEPSYTELKAPDSAWPRTTKRRSVWIVRPLERGPEHGLVNVHARLRAESGMESLRAFV